MDDTTKLEIAQIVSMVLEQHIKDLKAELANMCVELLDQTYNDLAKIVNGQTEAVIRGLKERALRAQAEEEGRSRPGFVR